MKKVTPVLVVDRIEPLLALWEALGFTRAVEVPHGDALGFVSLSCDAAEVMYQTFDSVRADEAQVLEGTRALGAAALFFEVDDLDAVTSKLPATTDVIVARRTTFYGSTETVIRDGAATIAGILLSQYLIWSIVCGDALEGVQGRYFLEILPLVLTALAVPRIRWRFAQWAIIAVAVVCNALAINVLVQRYW
jgi:hypothetical protein